MNRRLLTMVVAVLIFAVSTPGSIAQTAFVGATGSSRCDLRGQERVDPERLVPPSGGLKSASLSVEDLTIRDQR